MKDFLMDDGEVAFRRGKTYEFTNEYQEFGDFYGIDDQKDQHWMELGDLLGNFVLAKEPEQFVTIDLNDTVRVRDGKYNDYNGQPYDPGIGIVKNYATRETVIVEFQDNIPGLGGPLPNVDEISLRNLEKVS